ncbi:trypco2 family protein [Streptomyces sp. NPDC059506]|uniref:trypco2 family protein n=1 Tax=Streptomyces sp. NPDC059506 TaxID=3347751 RepID=UPI00367C1F0A
MDKKTSASGPDGEAISTLGLDVVLAALRRDLIASRKATVEEGAYGLGVAQAQVELNITVTETSSKGAHGGVEVKVVSFGGQREKITQDQRVHRIALTLVPVPPAPEETDLIPVREEADLLSGLSVGPVVLARPDLQHRRAALELGRSGTSRTGFAVAESVRRALREEAAAAMEEVLTESGGHKGKAAAGKTAAGKTSRARTAGAGTAGKKTASPGSRASKAR